MNIKKVKPEFIHLLRSLAGDATRLCKIIEADLLDPCGSVGCDHLTVKATERLAKAVDEMAKIRSIVIEPI